MRIVSPSSPAQPCARRGRYAVARLIEKHGDVRLTDLLQTLADCPKTRVRGIHPRLLQGAVYEGLRALARVSFDGR
jgi:hypothetical protein